MGGGFGSWLGDPPEIGGRGGMAGTMGTAFTLPILEAILTGELSPPKRSYVAAFIPTLFTATLGAEWAWGEPCTTQDLDLVANSPI